MKNKYITDAYYNENIIYDKIDFSEKINIDFLKLYGFNRVYIDIVHKVDEIDDGWQYVSVFNFKNADSKYYNMNVENDGYSIPNESKDWVLQSYPIGTFEFDKLENIPIFYIRYRGSGRGSDDWINKEVNINIIFERGNI